MRSHLRPSFRNVNGNPESLPGPLFFPVTPFTASGELDTDILAQHIRERLEFHPRAVFIACGTGEFHALSPEEYAVILETAITTVAGAVPVYAGTGGPVPVARHYARVARDLGIDGLLLLPPYLVKAPQSGLANYVREVCSETDLDVIVYSRDNAVLSPETAVELAGLTTVIGYKDGVGDVETLARTVVAVNETIRGTDKSFLFFNGLPTAEVTVPAYRAIGVELYSSAVFCFAPEVSTAFYDAVQRSDHALVNEWLVRFFHPFVGLRNRVPGYAISMVKAAVRLRGLDVGSVRAPLVDPTAQDLAELSTLLDSALAFAAEGQAGKPTIAKFSQH